VHTRQSLIMHGSRVIKTTPYGARNYNCGSTAVSRTRETHARTCAHARGQNAMHNYWSFKGKLCARSFHPRIAQPRKYGRFLFYSGSTELKNSFRENGRRGGWISLNRSRNFYIRDTRPLRLRNLHDGINERILSYLARRSIDSRKARWLRLSPQAERIFLGERELRNRVINSRTGYSQCRRNAIVVSLRALLGNSKNSRRLARLNPRGESSRGRSRINETGDRSWRFYYGMPELRHASLNVQTLFLRMLVRAYLKRDLSVWRI